MRAPDLHVTQTPLTPAKYVRATVTTQGAMVLDLRGKGTWHALSPLAALWWSYLADGQTFDHAATLITSRYDADPDRVRDDGCALLVDLWTRGLLLPERKGRRR